jgi:hypothetical protein
MKTLTLFRGMVNKVLLFDFFVKSFVKNDLYDSFRFGRKKTVVWHFVAGAIACVAVSFIPAGTNSIGTCKRAGDAGLF